MVNPVVDILHNLQYMMCLLGDNLNYNKRILTRFKNRMKSVIIGVVIMRVSSNVEIIMLLVSIKITTNNVIIILNPNTN